ncbi:MAG: hypothetical protein V9G20_20100 [Candidatus Promineifilaceae bacterium]|nr:hypothetical protein [Chloroflexota bacterium]
MDSGKGHNWFSKVIGSRLVDGGTTAEVGFLLSLECMEMVCQFIEVYGLFVLA